MNLILQVFSLLIENGIKTGDTVNTEILNFEQTFRRIICGQKNLFVMKEFSLSRATDDRLTDVHSYVCI